MIKRYNQWIRGDRDRAMRVACRLQGATIGIAIGIVVEAIHVSIFHTIWT